MTPTQHFAVSLVQAVLWPAAFVASIRYAALALLNVFGDDDGDGDGKSC